VNPWAILARTLLVGSVAVAAILVPGVALGYLLARGRFPGRSLLESLTALPMVLPPVAVGLVLLLVLGRGGPLAFLDVLFTWQAAAIASAVISFPLLVRAAEQAFHEVPVRLEQVARSLGASRWRTFVEVTLPLARRGIAYGTLLAFARALGEFGATTLVAGNIPGRTQTLSLGIYAEIQRGHDGGALTLAAMSAVIAVAATWIGELYLKGRRREGRA
jgi:molybdate transport system permease protein